MINVSEIVDKTKALFDLLNEHFYVDELICPEVTVSFVNGRDDYGWCRVREISQITNEVRHEINITPDYINRPIEEVVTAMLHEMAHLYNMLYGIKDVSNNGYYHNKKFKDTADAHGLHISRRGYYGWTIINMSGKTAEWVAQLPSLDEIVENRKFALKNKEKERKAGASCSEKAIGTTRSEYNGNKEFSIKYVCDACGAVVRSTKQVNVVCGHCDAPFRRV